MNLSGESEVAGTPETIFDRLLDSELLLRCIPGCERMDEIGPGEYETLVSAGVGPVKGRFKGTVRLQDVQRPVGYTLSVVGKSSVGHAQGSAQFRLEAAGDRTVIHYDGEAKVSGLIASVGGRLIDAAAKKVAREFFARLEKELGEASSS